MAYQQNQQKPGFQSNKPAAHSARPAAAGGSTSARKTVYKTGLFAPNKEGVKSLGSVQVKESITIPAGSYINLYTNDKITSDKSPVYNLSVTEGKLAEKK